MPPKMTPVKAHAAELRIAIKNDQQVSKARANAATQDYNARAAQGERVYKQDWDKILANAGQPGGRPNPT